MDRLLYLLSRALSAVIASLPIELVFLIGKGAGWLSYFILGPYRKLALRNLGIAYGREKSPEEIRKLAHQHFQTLGANLLSCVKVATMSKEALLKQVQVEGLELVEQNVRNGRGSLFLNLHMGNWEVLAQIAPLTFPCKGGAIYQRLGNEFMDAQVRAFRSRLGLALFERKEGFNAALALLRAAGAVGVMGDQHAGDAGTWSPLFGRLASTSPMPALLALRSGGRVLSAAVYTVGVAKWRFVIRLVSENAPGSVKDTALLTAEMNQATEAIIRESPADWLWVHNRWKTPTPKFLLTSYKRGIVLPKGMTPADLQPFRIVVRASNWLGDAVMSTPAVQAIKKGRPDVRLSVLTRAKLADYWRQVPGVDDVISIEPKESIFDVSRKLRGKFEVAVVLPNSIRTGLEVWLAGIPRRVGVPGKGRKALLNQLILPPKKRPAATEAKQHQLHHYLHIARSIGAEITVTSEQEFFKPEVASPETTAETIPTAPNGRTHPNRLKLGLCPGAEYGPAKRWLPERFAETASTIAKRHECEWTLFGVAGDGPIGEIIHRQLNGQCRNLIGKTSLRELIEELRQCGVLLTNDTGTMHLAAALGVPTVSVFGSTEPSLTGPLGPNHKILREQVECSPCFLRECPIDFKCMKGVTVEQAVAAIEEVLHAQHLGQGEPVG